MVTIHLLDLFFLLNLLGVLIWQFVYRSSGMGAFDMKG